MEKVMNYDVIVVGAGHAGCEAALAAARVGASVLLITFNMDHIAQMSCNPAIGGIAKGQVVREIDALGGAMGIVTEAASIQFRLLNHTKGPAVWSPRSQCDKSVYRYAMKQYLEQTPGIDILQSEVTGFILENQYITGVTTHLGEKIRGRAVVLTTGTSLNGRLHYGMNHYSGGRAGDPPSCELAAALADQLNLQLGLLKTGTPPRILSKTIDFSSLEQQFSEPGFEEFSFWSTGLRPALPEAGRRHLPCYMLHSTDATAEVVRKNLDKSPMYSGKIHGIGTRYCPSFEDKVVRFPQHPYHLLYLEPEGADTGEYYLNGFSSSLPIEVQKEMVTSLPGLENAVISRYAYAIEYSFLPPAQTERTLQNKVWPNLFTAGQINGTSGYEEAAGQGLIAGLNAARYISGKPLYFPLRSQSYIGVMLDDLTTKEIVEPYRLFTSRAEYRLTLRQENADLRLCEEAHELGLLPAEKYQAFQEYRQMLTRASALVAVGKYSGGRLSDLFRTLPLNTTVQQIGQFGLDLPDNRLGRRVLNTLLIETRYAGYLAREEQEIEKLRHLELTEIPPDFQYALLSGLCNESRQKLEKIRPKTLGQALRIDGVTPADVALLRIAMKRMKTDR